ncbi:30S ribosomal protein S13, partial [Candidatus Collierbacteria bacterium CG17_big_fil_post_rev_8_21_14_2_50_45_7]
IDLPENKRIEVALTYVYGIGPKISKLILDKAKIDPNLRAKDLTAEGVAKLQ